MNKMLEIGDMIYYKPYGRETSLNEIYTILAFSTAKKHILIESTGNYIDDYNFIITPAVIASWQRERYIFPDDVNSLMRKVCFWADAHRIAMAVTIILPNGTSFLYIKPDGIGSTVYYNKKSYEVDEISEDKKYYYVEESVIQ